MFWRLFLSVTEAIERYIFSDLIKRDTIRSYIAMIILVRIFFNKNFIFYLLGLCLYMLSHKVFDSLLRISGEVPFVPHSIQL